MMKTLLEMTSRSAPIHANTVGIAVLVPKRDGGDLKFRCLVKLRQRNFGNFWVATRTFMRTPITTVNIGLNVALDTSVTNFVFLRFL